MGIWRDINRIWHDRGRRELARFAIRTRRPFISGTIPSGISGWKSAHAWVIRTILCEVIVPIILLLVDTHYSLWVIGDGGCIHLSDILGITVGLLCKFLLFKLQLLSLLLVLPVFFHLLHVELRLVILAPFTRVIMDHYLWRLWVCSTLDPQSASLDSKLFFLLPYYLFVLLSVVAYFVLTHWLMHGFDLFQFLQTFGIDLLLVLICELLLQFLIQFGAFRYLLGLHHHPLLTELPLLDAFLDLLLDLLTLPQFLHFLRRLVLLHLPLSIIKLLL